MHSMELDLSDKIRSFLIEKNKDLLFDELSERFLESGNLKDILTGIPVPITGDATDNFTNLTIAMGMARVIGADPDFRYAEAYRACLRRMYGENAEKVLISEGAKAGGSGDYEMACIYFRTALQLNPGSRDALYLYGRACSDAYNREDLEEAYVGMFKAQAFDIFEELTIRHPDFDMGYYFLGYSYANMGQYTKAQITWQEFMELSRDRKDDADSSMDPIPADEMQEMREEIGNRLESMEQAVEIEHAVNRILSGDFQHGIDVLTLYEEKYSEWWPLWYYLGVAYAGMEQGEQSVEAYKHALRLSPSNIQVMTELVEVFQSLGDWKNAEKYIEKIRVVQKGMEEEAREQNEE